MELDDLKNTWQKTDAPSGTKKMDSTIIDKMEQKKIQSGFKKIALPEMLGSAVCIASAVYISLNFYKLDTVFYAVTGITCIAVLLILTFISISSVRQLYKTGDINTTYAETLKVFSVQKIKFCRLQKLNLLFSYLLLVTIVLLLPKLFAKKGVTDSSSFSIIIICAGYIILVFFSKWVFRSYNKTIRQTEDLLKDMAS